MTTNHLAPLIARLPASRKEKALVETMQEVVERLHENEDVVGSLGEIYGRGTESTVAAEVERASVKPPKGSFLYRLTRLVNPDLAVEFGGGFGVSGAYISMALRDNGTGGHLISVEGAPSRAKVARQTINSVAGNTGEVINNRFEEVFDVLDGAQLFFLDGYHTLEPTIYFVAEAVRRMKQPGLLVLDDIHWSDEMEDAWQRLRTDDRFTWSADVRRVGLLALGRLSLTTLLPRLVL